jgi:iron(III) transport system substrate-binding protein
VISAERTGICLALFIGVLFSEIHAATVAEIALYRGADRQTFLERGAREEKEFSWYTSLSTRESQQILVAFEKRYPFITTKLTRMTSERVVERFSTEFRANRLVADSIDVGDFELELLRRKGMLQAYYSPSAARFDERLIQPEGYWVATRFAFIVLGYNTRLVKRSEAPRRYEDLLDAKWKGKIAIERNYTEWFMALMQYWGEDKGKVFFQKLGQQGLRIRTGQTLMAQLITAGEDPLATITNHSIESLRHQEAPVEWVSLEPVIGKTPASALSKNAPHPHAAMLFLDFFLSKEGGQKIIREMQRIPTHPEVAPDPARLREGFKFVLVDPVKYLDQIGSYQKLWQDWILNVQ